MSALPGPNINNKRSNVKAGPGRPKGTTNRPKLATQSLIEAFAAKTGHTLQEAAAELALESKIKYDDGTDLKTYPHLILSLLTICKESVKHTLDVNVNHNEKVTYLVENGDAVRDRIKMLRSNGVLEDISVDVNVIEHAKNTAEQVMIDIIERDEKIIETLNTDYIEDK